MVPRVRSKDDHEAWHRACFRPDGQLHISRERGRADTGFRAKARDSASLELAAGPVGSVIKAPREQLVR